MSIIRRGVDRERRSWAPEPVIPPNSLAGALTYSGTTVTPDAALRIATVFACVRLLADSVSLTPLYVYENVNGIKSRVTDEAITSRLDDLFVDLNGDALPLWDGLQRWMTALALRGNAYAAVVGRDGRFPTKLLPLHPDDVVPKLRREGAAVKGWTWEVSRQDWPTEDLIHIPLLTQGTGPLGIGPLESRETFGLALASQQFGATFFAQGATTSGVIEVPGSLSSDEARTLAAQWRESHTGLGKAHIPAVLVGGASFRAISVTPEQAQMLATRAFQRGEIEALFGVPPHMLGDTDKTTSWGSGLEVQSLSFVRYTLRSYLKRIEHQLSKVLPEPYFARFDLTDLLQADTAQRFAAYQIARTGGWLSLNEIRQREDLAPIAGYGDDHLLPLNSALNGADLASLTADTSPTKEATP